MDKKKFRRTLLIFFSSVLLLFVSSSAGWIEESAASHVDPSVVRDSWDAVNDGSHNAFTDLIYWKDYFFLVYRSAPSHLDMRSKLVLMRSPDARTWEKLAELALSGEDIRDPKMAVIGNQLFLYALKNTSLFALPYATVFSTSPDGIVWEPWQDLAPTGWLFGRPKSLDGRIWVAPAYSRGHDQAALFQSRDGIHWEKISVIASGEPMSEVDLAFTSEDQLVAVIRLESRGRKRGVIPGRTLTSIASSPYRVWISTRSLVTRLDGPTLFTFQGSVFVVSRSEPAGGMLMGARGSLLNKKRTSIFEVTSTGLKIITDLPSAGDTSYPGVVVSGNTAYVSYYTNDTRQDLPWLVGMFTPSSIRIAEINLSGLKQTLSGLEGLK